MSVNSPPNPNVATFNNLYWISADSSLTQSQADLRYLKFPVAQGTENLQTTNVNGVATFNTTATFNDNTTFTGTADIIQEAGSEILQEPASTTIITNGTNQLNKTLVAIDTGGATNIPAFSIFNQTTGYATYFINNALNNTYDNIVQANDNVIASTRPFVLTNSSSSSTNGIRLSDTTSLIGYGGSADTPTTSVECNGTNVLVKPNIKFPDNSIQSNAYTGAGALAGSYTLSNITLDSNGKITSISNGSAYSPVTFVSTASTTGYNAGGNYTYWYFTSYPTWAAYSWVFNTPTTSRTNVNKTNLGSSPPLNVGTIGANGSFLFMTGNGISQGYTATSSTMITYCNGYQQQYTISAGATAAILSVINCIGGTPASPFFQSNQLAENNGTCPPTAFGLSGYIVLQMLNGNYTGLGTPTLTFTQIIA